MNCIPALVAGVKNIYLTTPALGSDVNPAIIYAAKKCGVQVSQVGEITEKLELEILQNSRLVSFSKTGYNHFDE